MDTQDPRDAARAALAPQVASSLELTSKLQLAAVQAKALGLDAAAWGATCAAVWGNVEASWRRTEEALSKKLEGG
jgi:hypothetical protein